MENAIVGVRTRLEKGVIIRNAMVMGADFYESEADIAALKAAGKVPVGVGANSHISNTILDKNCRVGSNCQIVNRENVQESNREDAGYYIRSGIVTVHRNAVIASGTVI